MTLEHCAISDNDGKIMQASGSELTVRDTLFSRSVMGPEINGTAILFEGSYTMEMIGPDDNDGIYLHNQQSGQDITLRNCVVARTTDDGIDTLGSTVTIENWERDRSEPRSNKLMILAGLLNVPVLWLLQGEGGPSRGFAGRTVNETTTILQKLERATSMHGELSALLAEATADIARLQKELDSDGELAA